MQSQKTVTAYFKSKQLLPFDFERQSTALHGVSTYLKYKKLLGFVRQTHAPVWQGRDRQAHASNVNLLSSGVSISSLTGKCAAQKI